MKLLADRRSLGLLAAAALCAAVVFTLSVRFHLGVAGGVPYVLVVLLAVGLPDARSGMAAAGFCTGLLLIESIISLASSSGIPFGEVLASRGLALVVIWATAAIGMQRARTAEALRNAQHTLEQRVAQRTAELAKANDNLQQQMAERERAEEALRQFEAMYHSLMETLPLNVFRKDLDGRIVLANKRHCETLGMQLAELIGKTDFDLFPRDLAEKYHRDDVHVIASGTMLEDVEQHRRPNGDLIYVQVLKAAVHDAAGNVIGVQGMFWDVTARRRAEVSLHQERYLLRSLMDNVPDAMFFKDRNGRFIRINRSLADEFRLADTAYAEGKTDFDFRTKEYAIAAAADERRILQTGKGFVNKEEQESGPDGAVRWLSTTKMPLHDKDGKVVGTVGISRDITFRKQAETALRDNAEQTRMIIDTAYDAFVAMDAQGKIIDWNPRAEAIFGWSRDEALGRDVAGTIIPERHREAHTDGLAHFLATGEGPVLNNRLEISALRRDGSEFAVEFTVTPIRRGNSFVFNAFLHDITRRKQSETELKSAKEAAEAASQAKSLFLANMSHEIRTPMNAILGMTDLVLGTELSPLQRDYLAVVQESGEALLLIIDDILDFSKIEAGRLEVTAETFPLADSIGDMMKLLALRAHSKGVELAFRVAPNVPRFVVGDRARLRQIVVNLVGNAIKFTEHGEVVLDVSLEPASGEAHTANAADLSTASGEVAVHFAIRDTGIGIPADKHQLIFEAFEQVDNTNTRKFGGAGLGLAISSRLVKLLGGRIWLDSEPGRGSTFHFTARFQPPRASEAAPPAASDTSYLLGKHVLLVDDNPSSRRILEEILRAAGAQTTVASGAYEAINLFDKARRAAEPVAAVITDASMPAADGFLLVEHLQRSGKMPPVVMLLSSRDRLGDIARCEAIGVIQYLVKPVKESEIIAALAAALTDSPNGAARTPLPSPLALPAPTIDPRGAANNGDSAHGDAQRLTVLLAEDSLVNQKLAVGLLEKHGHRVVVANTGAEALAAVRKQAFDVVLMDVQMPIMDGLTATKTIRASEQASGARLPIIALTAHAMKGDRELCLAAGMDGYVTKPVRGDELFSAIEAQVGRSPIRAEEPPAATAGQPSCPADHGAAARGHADGAPSDHGEGLDLSIGLEAVQGDRVLLRELIQAFLDEYPGLLADLASAIDRLDQAALRLSAHRLKGSMRYFGATRAFDQAYILESLGRDGRAAEASAALAIVREEVARLEPALRRYAASSN
jgi:PAS domain S-box-containing protein